MAHRFGKRAHLPVLIGAPQWLRSQWYKITYIVSFLTSSFITIYMILLRFN
jgi:hypothetical protein